MKEKTFKDLGLDEGDKYLEKMSLNLEGLEGLFNVKEDEKDLQNKIKDIKNEI